MSMQSLIAFALFRDGRQVSKAHASKDAAAVEAYEAGAVIHWGTDFTGDKSRRGLADGYELREVTI